MKIHLAGINHRTAPLTLREKAAVSPNRLGQVLPAVKSHVPCGVMLATCNRTEIYTIGPDSADGDAGAAFLRDRLDLSAAEVSRYLYRLHDREAVEHLFRVAAGLESMIVGEYEVLGQVGQALAAAEKAKMVHLPLRHFFQAAIRTGRRVREETGISRHAVSVSSVAVELAAQAVGDLAKCKILVIGTGEAGQLVAKAAAERGISRMAVVGRTLARARVLAEQLGGTPGGMDTLHQELADADIVISCSGAPHYTLNTGQVKRAMAGRPEKPLVIIDIAVPRNIEPAVGRIGNVFLHNIDDMTELANNNLKQRGVEIAGAERIVSEELASFHAWWREYQVRPVIKAMAGKAEAIRRTHLDRTLKKMPGLTEEEIHCLEMMTKAIVNRVLGDPIRNLKADGNPDLAETARQLFRLEDEDS